MNNIFLAPHSDDETLFGSFVIQRIKPLVVVCTDGTSHLQKFGIPLEQRRQESRDACKILGVKVIFLGIPEEELTVDRLQEELFVNELIEPFDCESSGFMFVPTETGGSPGHDTVSRVAKRLVRPVLYYSTYSRDNFTPQGEMPLFPTPEEKELKEKALACYCSQLDINKPHFDAVRDVPEYLNFKP